MGWREYHELTKHSVESLRRTQHYLDWVNMPDPFRHYEEMCIRDRLSTAAGVFPGNDPDVTRQGFAVAEPFRIAQKDIGCQGRDRSYAGMSHQQPGGGSLVCLLLNLLVQLFDLHFEPGVHRLQLTAPLSGMGGQR